LIKNHLENRSIRLKMKVPGRLKLVHNKETEKLKHLEPYLLIKMSMILS
jgi:hypothetical protein